MYFGKDNCFNITALSTFALIALQLLKMLVIITPSTYAGNYCLSLSALKYLCILNLLKCRIECRMGCRNKNWEIGMLHGKGNER